MEIRIFGLVGTVLVVAASLFGAAAPDSSASNRGDVGPNISITTLPTTITQDFNTLISSGSATWTNNSTLTGWYHARTGTGTTVVANNGSNNAGNLYSYGTGTNPERALGSIGSTNATVGNLFWGILLTNSTSSTITTFDVAYTGEQWRNSGDAAPHTVSFSYLIGTGLTGSLAEFQSAGTAVASLDFTSPITGGAAGALDGNLAANRTAITFSITGLSIAPGQDIMLRWSDPDHMGADHGLAIDDFSVTASNSGGPTPTPGATPTPTPSATPAPIRIHDIQGAAHLSPLSAQTVVNVPGIVTAKTSNGFFLQDPSPDSNDATSEGIFVFTSATPPVNVGDALLITGTVTEFRPGGSSTTNLTTTEISSPGIVVQSTGNPLPAPVVIGTGGRIPPTTVIDDDATGSVETSGTFDHTTDGIDFYESLEGMRVQMNAAVAVGPRTDFGEIPVLSDDGANATVRTTRGGIVVRPTDFNPERLFLDDVITATPVVNVGDHFSGPPVGVLDYSFGNFKLLITQALTAVAGGLTRETTTIPTPTQLAIATFNVENLDPGDPPAQFTAQASLIVNNLRSPDILTLEEIQDNNGPTNDAVVDATTTYNTLISAIQAAGGPAYSFRQINPVDDQDGGEPGGNIRVGFLFRTDRGLAFIDRPGGCSTCATTVGSGPSGTELSFSPGRVDPTNSAFNASRKPLAGEFTFNSHKLFLVANHFNSKGGDNPLFGRFQPPVLSSETQRNQQAQIVNNFVDSILALDSNAKIVVLGDLNDFHFSTPINTLKGGVLHALIATLPQSERYTYVFEGNSQDLDHILVSNSLFAGPFDYDVVHVNSEFADQTSDHDPQVVRLTLGATTPTPTSTPTPTPSPTATAPPTPSATPPTPSPSPSHAPLSPTPPVPPTVTPTATVSPTPATPTPTATPGCSPVTVSYSGVPVAIPDSNATGVNLTILVSGLGSITDLDFRFDGTVSSADPFSTTVGVNHSWVGDMIFRLTSPGGTTVTFYDRPGVPASTFGCSSNNLFNLTLDDEAGSALEGQCPGGGNGGPLTGSFTPNNPLSAFDGQNPNGTWTLTAIDAAGAGDIGTVRNFSLIFGGTCATPTPTASPSVTATPGCSPMTVSYSGPPVPIPDNNTTGVNLTVVVSGVSTITDLNFRFDGTVSSSDPLATTVGVNHSWVGDMIFRLTSPGGTTVTFYDRPGVPSSPFGCPSNNLFALTLDDEAGPRVEDQCPGGTEAGPCTGTFSPNDQLSAFDGQNPNGTWTLTAIDAFGGDVGTVRAFSLIFGGACGTPTATPTATLTPTATVSPTATVTPTPSATPTTPPQTCPPVITHSTSQAITPLNSVSCNNASGHTDNSYWRAFNMATFVGSQHFSVSSVSFGVEEATGAGGTQPVTVRLHTNSGGAFPGGTRTQIATATIQVLDSASGTVLSVPLVAAVPAGTLELVMEVFTPNGQATGNFFFIGSNTAAETGPSYLSAADCGIANPTDTAAIGFPDMNIVFNVVGVCAGIPSPSNAPPTQTPTPPVSPTVTPSATASPTPTATPSATPTPSPSPTPPSKAINLSTRMLIQTGENVGIGGFIISGNVPKDVIVRAIGPSLTQFDVPNALADPVLELHGPSGFATIANNNWRDTQEQEIQATGIPPTNDLESAIVATLDPGAYTAIVRGNSNTSGVGLVEVYDLNQAVDSKLANLSTRAFVSTGDNIVIAGFLLSDNGGINGIGGPGDDRVIVRGIGPSLAPAIFPVSAVLANPTLELRDNNGTLILSNNDWQDNADQAAAIIAAGLAPANDLESAIAATLPPGLYTGLLSGLSNGTGIGVVEIYDLGP